VPDRNSQKRPQPISKKRLKGTAGPEHERSECEGSLSPRCAALRCACQHRQDSAPPSEFQPSGICRLLLTGRGRFCRGLESQMSGFPGSPTQSNVPLAASWGPVVDFVGGFGARRVCWSRGAYRPGGWASSLPKMPRLLISGGGAAIRGPLHGAGQFKLDERHASPLSLDGEPFKTNLLVQASGRRIQRAEPNDAKVLCSLSKASTHQTSCDIPRAH
jgi:hypothetical protein